MASMLRNVVILACTQVLAVPGCDVEEAGGDADDLLDGELRGGCVYDATPPPSEGTYYATAGSSSGGCDLYVTASAAYYPIGNRLFMVEAVSEKPFSEQSFVIWGRACDDGVCGSWSKHEAAANAWSEHTGFCDAAQKVPCAYKLIGYVFTPTNPKHNQFRIGFRALDEDGDPVFMRYHVYD